MKKFIFIIVLLLSIIGINSEKAYASEEYSIQYSTHVQNIGWQNNVANGELSGTTAKALRVEAIKIDNPTNLNVRYQAHVENIGWQNWVNGGEIAGTTGKCLRVEALKVEVVNPPAGVHIEYQVHVENIGWMDWVKDGQVAGTTGKALRIEAVRIKIKKDNSLNINYKSHVQDIGWQDGVSQGEVSGAPGYSKRVEGVVVDLLGAPADMKLSYQGHVENIGWQNWVSSGQLMGTQYNGLRLEGFRVKLEGNTQGYHVIYSSYVEGYGWQGWVKDGEISGVVGKRKRIEGLMIRLVKDSELANYVKPKIAIDIGHNVFPDIGADGLYQESQLTKEVGIKVIDILKSNNYTVIDTLPESASSERDSLEQRTNTANSNEVNKFISIHFNKYGSDANGSEVYFQVNSDTSKVMATNILNNLVALGFKNRGIKNANYYVITNTKAPSVLVECAFLDNVEDMKKYDANKVAEAIAKGIMSS
ncbi:N-acetylmuramoyl-L-alanine amidase [Clostridium intestinale]|uniref:N-acetylmuramoyl-L-alanine amidase n=1 Tax=Clostridium intestinale TaxID=36845 RepID=UPI002DD6B190|nr:N-acetylmuramoyl-L-alanine amidase [Clostridium intestinale]WRY49805.1 N-acetylmuramoyl-L-alanine amidase [Clostridium intestinale]